VSRDWHRPYRTVPPHSGGDGLLPGELVRRHRGASPGRMMAPPPCVRALNARVRGRRTREGHPRAWRTPAEGGAYPRARRSPLEGSAYPRAGWCPPEGSAAPRAGRSLFEGILSWAASMGRRSPCGLCPAWLGTCVVRPNVFGFHCGF
jgi:hypothetical protein